MHEPDFDYKVSKNHYPYHFKENNILLVVLQGAEKYLEQLLREKLQKYLFFYSTVTYGYIQDNHVLKLAQQYQYMVILLPPQAEQTHINYLLLSIQHKNVIEAKHEKHRQSVIIGLMFLRLISTSSQDQKIYQEDILITHHYF